MRFKSTQHPRVLLLWIGRRLWSLIPGRRRDAGSMLAPTVVEVLIPEEFAAGLSQDRAVVEIEKSAPLGTHYGYNI